MRITLLMDKFDDVHQAIDAGDLERARDHLRPILKQHPQSAEAWYLAALAAVNDQQKQYFLQQAVDADPLHARAANMLHDMTAPPRQRPRPSTAAPTAPTHTPATESRAGEPADIWQRAIAFIFDQVILGGVLFVILLIYGSLVPPDVAFDSRAANRLGTILWLVTGFSVALYYGLSLSRLNGQTPGKLLMGLRVVKQDGSDLSITDGIRRCVFGYFISALPLGLGFFWVFYNADQHTWHDMLTQTRVVRVA